MNLNYALCIAALALGFVACGDDDAAPESSALTLSVDGAPVTLAAGETKTVTVSVRRPRSVSGAASLSVLGAPGGVSASVDPASATDSATVTIGSTPRAAAGTFTLTVLATADALAATANIQVTVGQPSAITVTGRVVNSFGQAHVPTALTIWSNGATTGALATVAADGTFNAAGVTPPYDARVDTLGETSHALYVGLTSSAPNLMTSLDVDRRQSGVQIQGTLSATPALANTRTYVVASCPNATGYDDTVDDHYGALRLYGTLGTDTACNASALRVIEDPETDSPATWVATQTQQFTAIADSTVELNFALGSGPLPTHAIEIITDRSMGDVENVLLWLASDGYAAPITGFEPGARAVLPTDLPFAISVTASSPYSGFWTQSKVPTATTTSVSFTRVPLVVFDEVGNGIRAEEVRFTPFAGAPAAYAYDVDSYDADGNEDSWAIFANGAIDAALLTARGMPLKQSTYYDVGATAFFTQQTVDALAELRGFADSYRGDLAVRYVSVGEFVTDPIPQIPVD